MELMLQWFLFAILVLTESLSIKSRGPKGEAWMIRSNLLAGEFNTLEVEKVESPTARSAIKKPQQSDTQAVLKRPTREPGTSIARGFEAAISDSHKTIHSKVAKKSAQVEPAKAVNENNDDNFLIRIDNQDATDNVAGEKRSLNRAIKSSTKEQDELQKKKVFSNGQKRTLHNTTVKLRQEIESNPETFAGEYIGKPYGDPDGYQTIGDGIFLMSTEQEAAMLPKGTRNDQSDLEAISKPDETNSFMKTPETEKVKGATTKGMPEPSVASLPEILTNLDKDLSKKNSTKAVNTTVKGKEAGASVSSSSEPQADMEAMTPVETKALQSFEDKLGQEDNVIGKLILTKNADKGQEEYIQKTNAMLQQDSQKQIDNVFSKFKDEESTFVKKNPFVINKPKLLAQIQNVTYHDVGATKRGFLGTNDNIRVEKVYNSLLKEDELISNGLNEKAKASVRKAISRHNHNPEDVQVNEFLNFLEKEDNEKDDSEDDDSFDREDSKSRKKHKKLNPSVKNSHLLVIEPSLSVLSDTYSSDGAPQFKDRDLKTFLGNKVKKKKIKKLIKTKSIKKFTEKTTKIDGQERRDSKTTNKDGINGKDEVAEKKVKELAADVKNITTDKNEGEGRVKNTTQNIKDKNLHWKKNDFDKLQPKKIKILEIDASNIDENEGGRIKAHSQLYSRKMEKTAKKKLKGKKKIKKRKYGMKTRMQAKNVKMEEGELSSELFVSPKKNREQAKNRKSTKKEDKEYYWHGTVKPETRQLPTDPAEQIRKFGKISNITPIGFESPAAEGVGEVIGDMSNIASVGTSTKENEFEDDNDGNAGLKEYGDELAKLSKHAGNRPVINTINENDISSTSFFSASKPRKDMYKAINKQGLDPTPQQLMNVAVSSIDSKDMQRVKGFVDNDNSKMMAMFDQQSMKTRPAEYDQSNSRENDDGSQNDDDNKGEYDEPKVEQGRGSKKHKMKIVLHLPEVIEGREQEIHGKDSETPIGTIKDLTTEYARPRKQPGLGQELADDDEDTLEEILSKPTGKLEQFHPSSTISAADYVPETIQGKESNEWNGGDDTEKETMNIELNEQGKERNENEVVDAVKSNSLLSMIKNNENLLQKALGRHGSNGEMAERFTNKVDENEDEAGNKIEETAQSKSVANKSKGKKKIKSEKSPKSENDKEKQSGNFEEIKETSPNIFADQMNYEHKSNEVSQVMPTETVNQIKQIFNADEHLVPINFLMEDQKALGKPGIGPLAVKNRKTTAKVGTKASPSANENKIDKNNPLANLVHSHSPDELRIQGGKIHGGDITGGFISGGEINGGNIQGGAITGGRILGGTFKHGKMDNGILYNGTVDGGLIKGGSIYGGKIEGGMIEGGKMKGGEIDGGKLSGGEIDGGLLRSGEVRGGFLKSGSVEGGVLRGGSIEGGHLLGGVMLGGKLKGGVVRSGVIRGGVIEGGIVDGGVIEDGVIIKGGVVRGTFPHNSTVMLDEHFSTDMEQLPKKKDADAEGSSKVEAKIEKKNAENDEEKTKSKEERSENKTEEKSLANPTEEPVERIKSTAAQMYKINVEPTSHDHSVETQPESDVTKIGNDQGNKQADNKDPNSISILGAPEGWPIESKDNGAQNDPEKQKVAPVTYSSAAQQKQKPAADKPVSYQGDNSKMNKVKTFLANAGKLEESQDASSDEKESEFIEATKEMSNTNQKSLMLRSPTEQSSLQIRRINGFLKNYGTTTRATIDKRPAVVKYHWSLNAVRGGKILGNPGKSMSVIGGIKVRSGVATLNDGLDRGYLDAGDYQGECVSDPDVCKRGLTLSITSKIYKDSAESPTRMYLFDSGAGSEDSRGMALWVNRGKIEGAVSSRRGTWCLEEDIGKFQDRWVDYVLTWHPMKGLYLYANCELMAVSGFGRGCDVCSRSHCHQEDKNTHLMFGRPNKGPHFKLTHFSSGDISVYEDFFNIDGVNQLCGTNNDYLKKPTAVQQRLLANMPIRSPFHPSALVMKKEVLSKTLQEFKVPSVNLDPKVVGNEFEVWPTPAGLQSLSMLFQAENPVKPATREIVKVDGGYSDWSAWTSCIGACGGTSMSSRYCNNPVPKHSGHDCSILGPARRTRTCDESNCLAPENLKALARLRSDSSLLENDISKRKEITTAEQRIDQRKDIGILKEEMSELNQR